MTIESSFIPFPSEVVIPPAAYMAAETGELNVFLVVLFATVGADLGALINYYLAYYLGRPVVYAFARSRWGHVCLIDEEKLRLAEDYFDRHGAIGTFIGRLVPAVRQLISIPAGLARMNVGRFLLYTTLGAAFWNSILAGMGYYLQSVVPINELDAQVAAYSTEVKYFMIAVGVGLVVFLVFKGRK